MAKIARRLCKTPAQIVLRWAIQHGVVGHRSSACLQSNCVAVLRVPLTVLSPACAGCGGQHGYDPELQS